MRQNRVDPFGALHAVPERGGWMGNRGCLHDGAGQIRRGWQGRRWITCVCAFRGRKRALMQPGRYTELFFLDEATAYAVGHRPCAECRRADWLRFAGRWAAVFGPTGAEGIDRALHAARLDGRGRRLVPVTPGSVPEGAMVAEGAAVLLRAPEGWRRWSFAGYTPAEAPAGPTRLLTPEPLARLMAAGLPVQIRDG
ncbi:MAG: hypothetical protein H6898_08615 [Rhodobacter sp.]|nr:hypothetical protein [Paracoccaceae bacterium]MCC0076637.1 hypothetical protein [Rhodobacter sp.]